MGKLLAEKIMNFGIIVVTSLDGLRKRRGSRADWIQYFVIPNEGKGLNKGWTVTIKPDCLDVFPIQTWLIRGTD